MKYSLFFVIYIFFVSTNAQTGKVNKANEAYENYAYIDAISTYEELIDKAERKMQLVEEAYLTSQLPEDTDAALIESLLVQMRREYYQ